MRNYCKSEDRYYKFNNCNYGKNNWKNNNWNTKEECQEFKCCCCPIEEKKEKAPCCKFCCQFEEKEESNFCQNNNLGWQSNNCNECNCFRIRKYLVLTQILKSAEYLSLA